MGNCWQCFRKHQPTLSSPLSSSVVETTTITTTALTSTSPSTVTVDTSLVTNSALSSWRRYHNCQFVRQSVHRHNQNDMNEYHSKHRKSSQVNHHHLNHHSQRSIKDENIYGDESHETEELLSIKRTSHKSSKHYDTKRNSFKKSLALFNGSIVGNSNKNNVIISLTETPEVSDNILNQLFEKYKEPNDDMILTDGIERLCNDLDYQPDEFAILVLAWCLDASQMCRFTRSEFIEGLHKMRADTILTIRVRLEQTIDTLRVDTELFKQLYRFTFRFGLEPDQRILTLDMAISLWKLVFTVHTPILLCNWLNFLEEHPSIRGIPKDTWNMFLNFAEQCDIYNYDDTEAWPSLFDDFVEYEKYRIENSQPRLNADINKINFGIAALTTHDNNDNDNQNNDGIFSHCQKSSVDSSSSKNLL